jgi:uncharacterized OB-fold protein
VQPPRPIAPDLVHTSGAETFLRAAACDACGKLHFPAGDACPYCGGVACRERLVGRSGTLFLHTAIASRPPGYRGELPFGFGVVELPEGLRVVTRLTEADPARLRQGQPMRLVVTPLHTDDDGTPVVSYAYAPEDA